MAILALTHARVPHGREVLSLHMAPSGLGWLRVEPIPDGPERAALLSNHCLPGEHDHDGGEQGATSGTRHQRRLRGTKRSQRQFIRWDGDSEYKSVPAAPHVSMVGMRTEVYPHVESGQVVMRPARVVSENNGVVEVCFDDACAAERGQRHQIARMLAVHVFGHPCDPSFSSRARAINMMVAPAQYASPSGSPSYSPQPSDDEDDVQHHHATTVAPYTETQVSLALTQSASHNHNQAVATFTETQVSLALSQTEAQVAQAFEANAFAQARALITDDMVDRVTATAVVANAMGDCVITVLDDIVVTVAKELRLERAAAVSSTAAAASSPAASPTAPTALVPAELGAASQTMLAAPAPVADANSGVGPSSATTPEWLSAAHLQLEREQAARVERLAKEVSAELRSTGMAVPPLNVVADQIEFVLLGPYPLKSIDDHVKTRMCEYFTDKWHEDVRNDWADFGTSAYWTARRNPRRKRQRLTSQDRARG